MDDQFRYKILETLNPRGNVYLAMDRVCLQKRVLKVLDQTQFQRELYFLRLLQGQKVPSLVDVCVVKQGGILVLKQEEGETLQAYIQRKGRLSYEEVGQIALSLTEILCALQKQDPPILHLDLKPSNVIRHPDGSLCLLDLGTAVLCERNYESGRGKDVIRDTSNRGRIHDRTVPGGEGDHDSVICGIRELYRPALPGGGGTYGYTAPEIGKEKPGRETDVYSIGLVMLRMVTGYGTKNGAVSSSVSLLSRHREGRWQDFLYSRALHRVIRKASRKNRKRRYRSAEELHEALIHLRETAERNKERKPSGIAGQLAVSVWCAALILMVGLYAGAFGTHQSDTMLAQVNDRNVYGETESGTTESTEEEIWKAGKKLIDRLQYTKLLNVGEDFSVSADELRGLLWEQELYLENEESDLQTQVTICRELCRIYLLRQDILGRQAEERVVSLCRRGLTFLDRGTGDVEAEMYFLQTAIGVLETRKESTQSLSEETEFLQLCRTRLQILESEN